ncbi:type 4 pilus major pilin [Ramlibacter sp. AN1133]|uniref:type 4 pilus major pilin n=1 Tax=Ramlibacter sp. AN1133 TaxID=3133429 RepID=UPI0030C464B9
MKGHTMHNITTTTLRRNGKKQRGFTMVELIVVLGIIALLAIFGMPFARALIIDGKVPDVAQDINKTATKVRNSYAGGGATPYSSINTAGFANLSRGLAGSITVTGTGAAATMSHDIGQTGSTITVASNTITTAGDSFAVTMNTVNEAACPSLAAQLGKAAEQISINGTVVKAVNGTFNSATASTACTTGDGNTYVFVFR